MLKKSTNHLNLISIFILCYLAFLPFKPSDTNPLEVIYENFFLEQSLEHVKNMSQKTHFTGSENHSEVKKYIRKHLEILGLRPEIQETQIVRGTKTVKVENIIARINGTKPRSPALLIMSHYDSAPYSSHGASDALSGVAVIIEGIRSYLNRNSIPRNNIIILFTDAEEIGLLGAKAFVNKHPWAKNIGAILNFEARGTAGPSSMLMETNHGNRELLKAFKQADVKYPSSSSLHYSIYKLLPSDMDMTVFREDLDIPGYNFAFIDDHFNYHTELDNFDNLSVDSFAHQAYYLLPMLEHLSVINLNNLKSDDDDVYFHFPFLKTINYPYSWTTLISVINILLFISIVYFATRSKIFSLKKAFSAGLPLFKSLISTVLVVITLLKFLYWLHPQYSEMLQGFTYNGSIYIAFFSFLSLSLLFFFYQNLSEKYNTLEIIFIPLTLWIIISLITAIYLKGAHFISVVPLLTTIAFAIYTFTSSKSASLLLLVLAPAIIIIVPLVIQVNVAMGLSILPFASAVLVLFGSLVIPSIIVPKNYKLSNRLLLILPLSTLVYAELNSSISESRPLPNSLNYYQDDLSQQAYWLSADENLDEWTNAYFKQQLLNDEEKQNLLSHKVYRIKHAAKTENLNIPTLSSSIEFASSQNNSNYYKILLTPNRSINKLVIRSAGDIEVQRLSLNSGIIINNQEFQKYSKGDTLATHYITDEKEIVFQVVLKNNARLDLEFVEYSADLLKNETINVKPRPKEFIAKPYAYSDLIITRKSITF